MLTLIPKNGQDPKITHQKELQLLLEMQADDRVTTRIEKYSKMGDFEVMDISEKKTSKRSKILFGQR